MMGVNLSRSTVRYFRHNDMVHLESLLEAIAQEDKKLKRDTSQQRRFIIAEAVYRNIGDICPLKEILKIKEKYFYRLVLDETYSFGILGKTGRGLTEHVGIKSEEVEVITMTLDTVLGSVGGICIGNHGIVDHQRLSGAGYCFSASLAPFLAASAIAALKKIQNDSSLITKLSNVSKKLYAGFAAIPELKIISDEITGIAQLTLKEKYASDLEEAILLQKIADYCLQNGIAICFNKYALLHSKSLRPSLMVCANAHWSDETIRKIVDTVAKGSKAVFKSK
jgi:serine palmitoyltransferase